MADTDEIESDMDQPTREIEAYSGEEDEEDDDEHLNEKDDEDDTKDSNVIDATEANDDDDDEDDDSVLADADDGDDVDTVESEGDGASTGTPATSEGGDSQIKQKKSSPVSASRTGRKGRTPSVAGLTIPFRTVKKAMKLDPDTPIVQNEAAIMTTIAAELFLKRLAKESFHSAKLRGRNTIRYEDIAEARTKNPSMTFLETLLP